MIAFELQADTSESVVDLAHRLQTRLASMPGLNVAVLLEVRPSFDDFLESKTRTDVGKTGGVHVRGKGTFFNPSVFDAYVADQQLAILAH